MRFLVDQRIFLDPRADPALWSLTLAVLSQEHLLLLRPAWRKGAEDQPVDKFLARLGNSTIQGLVRGALERGLQALGGQPVGRAPILVAEAEPTSPPNLSPLHAARLAWTPLWLLLENGRNDLLFLRKILPTHERDWLDRQIQRGQVEVPPGGGTGELQILLETLVTAPTVGVPAEMHRAEAIRALRAWAMFDRDSNPMDVLQPSKQSERLRELCEQGDIPYCQLGRRTMESYLPSDVLRWWARRGRDHLEKGKRNKAVAAYQRLSVDQRRAYNWKAGLWKDASAEARRARKSASAPPDGALPVLFQGLPEADRLALANGFGDDIGQMWSERHLDQGDVEATFQSEPEAGWRQALVTSLRESR